MWPSTNVQQVRIPSPNKTARGDQWTYRYHLRSPSNSVRSFWRCVVERGNDACPFYWFGVGWHCVKGRRRPCAGCGHRRVPRSVAGARVGSVVGYPTPTDTNLHIPFPFNLSRRHFICPNISSLLHTACTTRQHRQNISQNSTKPNTQTPLKIYISVFFSTAFLPIPACLPLSPR